MNAAGKVSIRLERCARTYEDGTRALEATDLTIQAGETVVFLGPSGCGKTTILRLVAGLDEPDAGGKVWFGDEDVTAIPIERRNVGMVFQSYALFPNMSVEENVAYGLRVRKVPSNERSIRVRESLEMMHISDLATRRIDQLSGGQRQRVALARAIAPRPRVLLLDEPLTALDAKLRENLRVEIDRLLRSLEITTVYVTHDQGEAMALGDRIAVMDKGRIAQIGTPEEIYRAPANAFVADFIGIMNRVYGRLENDTLLFPGGQVPWTGPAPTAGLMFRPEDLKLAAPGGGNFSAQVVTAFFLGDHVRLVLDAGAPDLFIARVFERRNFVKGETVEFTLSPQTMVSLEN
ncbi:MAG: ABC transporter ATP-binding protein [Proteobacteria bacterium]|nr:ABC transporter ATP-binding protein [Pseudomonadota bacterium]